MTGAQAMMWWISLLYQLWKSNSHKRFLCSWQTKTTHRKAPYVHVSANYTDSLWICWCCWRCWCQWSCFCLCLPALPVLFLVFWRGPGGVSRPSLVNHQRHHQGVRLIKIFLNFQELRSNARRWLKSKIAQIVYSCVTYSSKFYPSTLLKFFWRIHPATKILDMFLFLNNFLHFLGEV